MDAVTVALLFSVEITMTFNFTAGAEVGVLPEGFFTLWMFHLLHICKSTRIAEDLQEFPHWCFSALNPLW